LLINGEDFEQQPEPEYPALACRYYINGLPTLDQLKNCLQELNKNQE
jgi:hypothetical protein